MNHDTGKLLNLLTTTTLLIALGTACGGSDDVSRSGEPSGDPIGLDDAEPAGQPTSPSQNTSETSEGAQCLENSCRAQLSACGADCRALNMCIADCGTEACVRACADTHGSASVDQLLDLYDCSDAHCGTGEPAPEPEPEPEPTCEDVASELPGTVWAGFLCEDGRVGSACPDGANRNLFVFRFERNGTYQLETIIEWDGESSRSSSAGRWRTGCGELSTTTCGGTDQKNYAAHLDGNTLHLANLELGRWDEGLDIVQFSRVCR